MKTLRAAEDKLDLVEVLTQNKLKKLDKSFNATTYFNNRAVCIAESARTAKVLGVTLEEHELRNAYYSMLDTYYQKNSFRMHTHTKKSVTFWKKVNDFKNEAGVDANTYIKAQFAWFSSHFGCAPSLPSLITANAVKRAVEYGGSLGNVVASAVPMKSELASVLKNTDEIVRAIMKANKWTREEFYINLVLTKEFQVPKVYLDADPVYRRLVK